MSAGPKQDTTHTVPASSLAAGQLAQARVVKRSVLLMIYHRDGVEPVPLTAGAGVVVGREQPPADVAIADNTLSRRHARFTLVAAEEVVVEDLGSLNGTRVGGSKVERATVKPGDLVMLGSIAVSVHVVTGAPAPALGLEGHDAFRAALETEITRTSFFGRRFAVMMIRPAERAEGALPRWCLRVRKLLRPVDRIARYGGDTVEILLPEATQAAVFEIGHAAVERQEGEPPLLCGIAFFPGAAASAEEIVEVSLDAARRATREAPVCVASDGPRTLRADAPPEAADPGIVALSPAMRGVIEMAGKLGRSTVSVLLHGETGAGKEVLARLVHAAGPRRGKPLVCVNCGAIPASLVESTLFGHEAGAFTGAAKQHKGVFETADGGTVLLDEIGELPAAVQATLLRVLENKRFSRVGSPREIEVDVRVIAATHRDLEAMCDAGTFRTDLYFRLNTMVLEIPPLRARREDVAPLAARFLQVAAKANDRADVRAIAPEAIALLERHAWPGNVRELKNAIEHAVVIADGDVVTARDLPERVRAGGRAIAAAEPKPPANAARHAGTLKERMDRFERETLVAALRDADDNQSEAARRLDMPLRTLQHKVKVYGIKRGSYAAGDPEANR